MVRIQLTGEMFRFEGSPELRNVSGWVDWRQFATVKDAAGTQLTMEEMEALGLMNGRLYFCQLGNTCVANAGLLLPRSLLGDCSLILYRCF